jgi:hypothetical protein
MIEGGTPNSAVVQCPGVANFAVKIVEKYLRMVAGNRVEVSRCFKVLKIVGRVDGSFVKGREGKFLELMAIHSETTAPIQ